MPSSGTHRVAERLYYDDPGLTFYAQVTEIQLVAQERSPAGEKVQLWRVALDRTAFYPESGGQPWDTGRLTATARSGAQLEVHVERVEEDEEGQVWHFIRKPLLQDTTVRGEVDGSRRLDHVQQHSGQHLLSAVFLSQCGMVTSSFHLGAEVSTIELSRPDGLASLDAAQVAGVEDTVNRLIAGNHPLRLHLLNSDEAERMLARGELRKLPERDGPFRVVEIAGVEWNACGGTHVQSTAEIGCVLLRRVEKAKQGVLVEFVCGLRAARRSRAEFIALQHAAQLLGTGWTDVAERLKGALAQQKADGKRLAAIQAELASSIAQQWLRDEPAGVLVRTLGERDAEFVRRVGSSLAAAGRSAVLGGSLGGQAFLSLSTAGKPHVHAGEVLRRVASELGVRGGGGATLAQAACSPEQLPGLVHGLVSALAES